MKTHRGKSSLFWPAVTRTGWLSAWLMLFIGGPLLAGPGNETPPESASAQTAFLEYRELDFPVITWGLPIATQAGPFRKEPDLGRRNVIRGTFKLSNSTAQFVPFIWDTSDGKLYLDLNRNQDFTDDAGGEFSCSQPLQSGGYAQIFPKVRLTFQTPMGNHRLLADLTLYHYSPTQPNGSLAVRSIWEARVPLQGRDWQVGIAENIGGRLGTAEGGYLVLRPWEARNEGFDLQNGSLDGFNYRRQVFFGEKAYQVDCAYVQQQQEPKYKITLQERDVPLGQVRITGKFIKRLVLPGTTWVAVLDAPGAVVRVPVDQYSQQKVQLKADGREAFRELGQYGGQPNAKVLTVSTTNTALLAVGGPLTNSVSADRRGRMLSMNYRLIGADGETYIMLGARQQPEFAVYHGAKRVGSGKFEFG